MRYLLLLIDISVNLATLVKNGWIGSKRNVVKFEDINYNFLRVCLVHILKHMFLVFKQYYTYFHIFFHPHVYQKNTNNITQTPLLNRP